MSGHYANAVYRTLLRFSVRELAQTDTVMFTAVHRDGAHNSEGEAVHGHNGHAVPLENPQFDPIFRVTVIRRLSSGREVIGLEELLRDPPVLVLVELVEHIVVGVIQVSRKALTGRVLRVDERVGRFIMNIQHTCLVVIPGREPSIVAPHYEGRAKGASNQVYISRRRSVPEHHTVAIISFGGTALYRDA